jgi:cytochrome c-type biogenesis protein CcmH/NrfG
LREGDDQAVRHLLAVRLADWARLTTDGGGLYCRGDVDGAIEVRSAIELQPGEFESYDHLGLALLRKNATGDAIAAFRAGLQVSPTSSDGFNHLGMALAAHGDAEGAIAAFEKALQLNPEDAGARKNLDEALRDARSNAPKGQL